MWRECYHILICGIWWESHVGKQEIHTEFWLENSKIDNRKTECGDILNTVRSMCDLLLWAQLKVGNFLARWMTMCCSRQFLSQDVKIIKLKSSVLYVPYCNPCVPTLHILNYSTFLCFADCFNSCLLCSAIAILGYRVH